MEGAEGPDQALGEPNDSTRRLPTPPPRGRKARKGVSFYSKVKMDKRSSKLSDVLVGLKSPSGIATNPAALGTNSAYQHFPGDDSDDDDDDDDFPVPGPGEGAANGSDTDTSVVEHDNPAYETDSDAEGPSPHWKDPSGQDPKEADDLYQNLVEPGGEGTPTTGEENVEVKPWNVFREFTEDTELYSNQGCIDMGKKLIKATFMLLAFAVVLGGTLISKLVLLLITSNTNLYVGTRRYIDHGLDVSSCGVQVCVDGGKLDGTDTDRTDAVRWLWANMLCMCTPYVLIFLRSLWKVAFKKKRAPKFKALAFVTLMETIHVVGLFCLLFLVLPYMDSLRAVIAMTGVVFIPGVMRVITTKPPTTSQGRDRVVDVICTLIQLSAFVLWIALLASGYALPERESLDESCNVTSHSAAEALANTNIYIDAFMANATDVSATIEPLASSATDPITSTIAIIATNLANATDVSATTEPLASSATDSITSTIATIATTMATEAVDSVIAKPLGFSATDPWCIMVPISLFLISFVWWDNFVDSDKDAGDFSKWLYKMQKMVRGSKTKIYLWVSMWKLLVTFALFIGVFSFQIDGGVKSLFDYENFRRPSRMTEGYFETDFLKFWGIQAGTSLGVYYVADTVIKAKVQKAGFFAPLALATPASFGFLVWMCYDCNGSWNLAEAFNFDYYWNCFSGQTGIDKLVTIWWIPIGLLWWASMLWIGRHIASPSLERLAKTDRIFVQPMYCGVLLEQSLIFNRRRNDQTAELESQLPDYMRNNETNADGTRGEPDVMFKRPKDSTPYIFCCATMWHENDQEMIQILKSIFRLDADQSARAKAQEYFKIVDPDFYMFEVHVFFDDAFEAHSLDEFEYQVNTFVKNMVAVINKAAMSVHHVNLEMPHPHKYLTPYGGRLEYTLPGGNHMIVHMKDKMKIRHKKRWSQVMYMYYILGHRLWGETENRKRKEVIANNTYLLALDGDVDFKPEAVLLLVDLMKRNFKVGAACGRIHPVGSGPMVWYQKFEYAISHWMQKATEHVLGCVLCSPGCFSLFRGSALMDDNVMRTYTTQASEPIQYVQYDQGEDRWLCTLLLQQGYRVEYSAAADAMTYAPEGFNEFFNQRRRWTPSTMANIMDLLASGRATVNKNENISMLYIVYQAFLFVSGVIGPATIFLLVVGALQATLGIPQWVGFLLTGIPIVAFFIVCLVAKSDTQLMFALILTGLLMAVQMVVGVSMLINLVSGGLCDPDSLFIFFIMGVFVLAAILHPQEGLTLIYIIVYFVFIPTMYLILIIYALCNMHVVSWGTREVVKTKIEKEKEMEKELLEEVKKKKSLGMGLLPGSQQLTGVHHEDGWTSSCGDCCRCMCCPRPGMSYQDKKLEEIVIQINQLKDYAHKSIAPNAEEQFEGPKQEAGGNADEEIESEHVAENEKPVAHPNPDAYIRDDSDTEPEDGDAQTPLLEDDPEVSDPYFIKAVPAKAPAAPRSILKPVSTPDTNSENERAMAQIHMEEMKANPPWINDPDIGTGPKRELSPAEITFWDELIEDYLKPLENNKEYQQKVAMELKGLRNKAVAMFFVLDILLIVLIQSLYISIAIGSGEGMIIHYNCTSPIKGTNDVYDLEPIGILFLIVFGAIMVIQMTGMIMHRWFSLLQVVSSTRLFTSRYEQVDKMDPRAAVDLVKDLQRLELEATGDDGKSVMTDFDTESTNSTIYDDTIANHSKNAALGRGRSRKTYRQNMTLNAQTLDKAFSRRFLALNKELKKTELESAPANGELEATASSGLRNRRRALFSTWRKAGQSKGKSFLKRKNTHHDKALKYVVSQRDRIFTDEKEQELRERHHISEHDIAVSRDTLGNVVPKETLEQVVGEDMELRARSESTLEGTSYANPTFSHLP